MSELETLRMFRQVVENMVVHDENQRKPGVKVVDRPRMLLSTQQALRLLLNDTKWEE